MTLLTVIILILLSITIWVAWKHWDLLQAVRGEDYKSWELFGDKIVVDTIATLNTSKIADINKNKN